MAKFRYIGPEPRQVPWLGQSLVQPDDVVTVPDEHYEAYACQPGVWKSVAEPRTERKTSAKDGAEGGKN